MITEFTSTETWLAKASNVLVGTYTTDVAGKLSAGCTALKGLMDTYKT